MAREYIEIEATKDDKYIAKKEAARLLYLARKALFDVKELEDSREVSIAITKCEEASMWLDCSEIGHILECEW